MVQPSHLKDIGQVKLDHISPRIRGIEQNHPKKSFGIPPIIDAPHKAPFVEYRDDI